MSNVIKFQTKQQKELQKKLDEVIAMFETINKTKKSIKCKWIFVTRDNFIRVIEGDSTLSSN